MTIVATNAPAASPGLFEAYVGKCISKYLERLSTSTKALRAVGRVRGPLSLRRLSGLSQFAFAEVLAHYVGQIYARSTVCLWERAERRKGHVPPAYWAKHYAPAKVVAAMHRLIADLVTWASGGRYRARIRGTRKWTITLQEVRHAR